MSSRAYALVVATLLASCMARAELRTAAEIEVCVQRNLPRSSSVQTVVFRSRNRIGDVTESRADLHWKLFEHGESGLSKVLLRFSRPLDLRGAGVLLEENENRRPDVFMYLPELRKVRRVSSRAAASSLFGTDFSYEDFERLVGMSTDLNKERLADGDIEGHAVYVIVGRPDAQSGSAYEKVMTYVDKTTCVPLRTESYDSRAEGGSARKLLTVDASKVEKHAGLYVPMSQTMRDLRDETQTELVIEKIEVNAKIHRKMFSTRELEAGVH